MEQFFYKLVLLCVFFFDSRAKARLIHLDSFLKPNFPMFFRKVKISWLSKNDRVIGARRLVKTMCHFSQKLADTPPPFFVLNFQFFFVVYFFFCSTPCFFFFCGDVFLLKSVVVPMLWSLFFLQKILFPTFLFFFRF